jgi:hypothetical protein
MLKEIKGDQDSVTPEGNEKILNSQTGDSGEDSGDSGEDSDESKDVKGDKDYEELYKNQKIRAEKAEQELKKHKKSNENKVEHSTESDLSQRDLIALIGADISEEEDIELITDYSKIKKIPISEAIKRGTLKAMLAEQKEKRMTANATSVGGGKKSSYSIDESTLLSNAHSGEIPERDEDIKRLVDARIKSKARKK